MKNSKLLSCYSILSLSIFFTIILPFVFSLYFPEIYKKGVFNISLLDVYPLIYIALLILFSLILLCKYPVIIISDIKNLKIDKYLLTIGCLILFSIWSFRTIYHIYISSSPYILLHIDLETSYLGEYFSSMIVMIYNHLNFNLYPFFAALIIIILGNLNHKYLILFILAESLYSISIGSKAIILYSLICLSIYYHNQIKKLLFALSISIIVIITKPLFTLVREFHINNEVNFSYDIISYLVTIIQRAQTFIPIFYYNQKLDELLHGMSFFRIIAYIVPDRLVNLPYYAKNQDEDIFLTNLLDTVQYGYMLDDDLFNFYSEPYANFGILGVCLIFLYTYFWSCLLNISVRFIYIYFPLYSFFVCNLILRPHMSFSNIIAYSIVILFISWALLRIESFYYKFFYFENKSSSIKTISKLED